MKNKITKIMDEYSLTPSEFADKIGVNRSSISHVISGRNNPSIEFIRKIVKTFPSISYKYLIEPECNKLYDNTKEELAKDITKQTKENKVKDEEQANYSIKSKPIDEAKQENKVIKIVMFYSDNTFEIYKN